MIQIGLRKKLWAPQGEMHLSISETVEFGQFIAINGPSGAGKTTFLRLLSGLMKPDSGTLQIDNITWFDAVKKIHLKPQTREIGFVFQDFALFPNMTVLQNLTYALKKGQEQSKVEELIHLMELGKLSQSKPDNLSGGQKQRVALARALVREPKLLLLDEPLSALDPEMRIKLQHYLALIHKQFNMTIFMVSHDVQEVANLATQLWELKEGKLIQKRNPQLELSQEQKKEIAVLRGTVIRVEPKGNQLQISLQSEDGIQQILANKDSKASWAVGTQIHINITSSSNENLI